MSVAQLNALGVVLCRLLLNQGRHRLALLCTQRFKFLGVRGSLCLELVQHSLRFEASRLPVSLGILHHGRAYVRRVGELQDDHAARQELVLLYSGSGERFVDQQSGSHVANLRGGHDALGHGQVGQQVAHLRRLYQTLVPALRRKLLQRRPLTQGHLRRHKPVQRLRGLK